MIGATRRDDESVGCVSDAPLSRRLSSLLIAGFGTAMLAACGSAPRQDSGIEQPSPKIARAPDGGSKVKPMPSRTSRGGGYYLDDGPGDSPPPDLDSIPEPVPQLEPLSRGAMRPYVVLGQTFTPMTELQPYKARGIASWYGRRYHGKQTSTGEPYDMYSISAAHPTLPLPSYARVTNVASGRSIIVRVNDRGPFIDNRLIDLSYTAAYRLGVTGGGSALVDVETIIPDGSTAIAAAPARPRPTVASAAPSASSASRTTTATAPAPRPGREPDPIIGIIAAARDIEVTPPAAADVQGAAPPPDTPVDYSGVYLQLAAFGSRENAESYLARARAQFDWMAERLQVRVREGLYRVHAGPYATPTEAKLAAERIAAALGARPAVVR